MASKRTERVLQELRVLRLIASGLDVRQCTDRRELQRRPSLRRALSALDELQSEIGWKQWDSKSDAKRSRKA
jgi:hypothetical protein